MARLDDVLAADMLGGAWLRSVLASSNEVDGSTFLIDEGAEHTKHVWLASQGGLHHTVIERDPARPGYYRPTHAIHAWSAVSGVSVRFEGLPNDPTQWVAVVGIADPSFSRTSARDQAATQALIDFGMECLRRATGSG